MIYDSRTNIIIWLYGGVSRRRDLGRVHYQTASFTQQPRRRFFLHVYAPRPGARSADPSAHCPHTACVFVPTAPGWFSAQPAHHRLFLAFPGTP
jgi:hypothetical protein